MEKIHDNTCKQACSYVFKQENYIKARVVSPFSAHFHPPLHHNGKGSIDTIHAQVLRNPDPSCRENGEYHLPLSHSCSSQWEDLRPQDYMHISLAANKHTKNIICVQNK